MNPLKKSQYNKLVKMGLEDLADKVNELAGHNKSMITENEAKDFIRQNFISKEKVEEAIKALEKENPYPENVFLPITHTQFRKIHTLLLKELKIPLDRVSGNISRRVWNVVCFDLRKELLEDNEK